MLFLFLFPFKTRQDKIKKLVSSFFFPPFSSCLVIKKNNDSVKWLFILGIKICLSTSKHNDDDIGDDINGKINDEINDKENNDENTEILINNDILDT